MDADRKAFEAVSDENRKLLGVIEELNTKIRNLQGEVNPVKTLVMSCLFALFVYFPRHSCLIIC